MKHTHRCTQEKKKEADSEAKRRSESRSAEIHSLMMILVSLSERFHHTSFTHTKKKQKKARKNESKKGEPKEDRKRKTGKENEAIGIHI